MAARANATGQSDQRIVELRRRVVEPVVAALLNLDEHYQLEFCEVDDQLLVEVTRQGETGGCRLGFTRDVFTADPHQLAVLLASDLHDWVCETRFAWGQQRIANYQLPIGSPSS